MAAKSTMRSLLKYVLLYHEWCEYPLYIDARCGHMHQGMECSEIDLANVSTDDIKKEIPCKGCKMRENAVKLLREGEDPPPTYSS